MITQEWKTLYTTLVRAGEISTKEVTEFGPVPNYSDKACTALLLRYLADNPDMLVEIQDDIAKELPTSYEWLIHLPLGELGDAAHFEIQQLRRYCADYPALYDAYLEQRAQGEKERRDFDDECDRMRG